MIEEKKISRFNKQGIIPGPDESEEHFLKRADMCLNFKEKMGENLESPKISLKQFDVDPNWVPILYSNDKLSLWQGGCTWIVQLEENAPQSAFLQLRKSFKKHPNYLFLYNHEEMLKHEFAHVGRLQFEEPKFEEFFAYASSPSSFRRVFGPIIQSSKESFAFFIVLLLIFLSDISLVTLGNEQLFFKMMWLKLIPLTMIIAGCIRLFIRHRTLNQCLQKVPAPVAYRLTDKEIQLFSKWDKAKIMNYIEENKEKSLRWKAIFYAYY